MGRIESYKATIKLYIFEVNVEPGAKCFVFLSPFLGIR